MGLKMYVKVKNGQVDMYPYSLPLFRSDNPNVSFPANVSESVLATYGVFPVKEQEKPEFNSLVQNCVLDATPRQEGSSWVVGFSVKDKPLPEAEGNVRHQRDLLLAQSDWVVIVHTEKGVSIPEDWQTYRQSLRDITAQSGFPYNVSWPTVPGSLRDKGNL
jgi:hypothetical protein